MCADTINAGKTPIFILGSARSGTTLLQRMLNSYDDVLVWGEHHGILSPIAQAYFMALEGRPWEVPHVFQRTKADWRKIPTDQQNWSEQVWLNPFGPEEWGDFFSSFLEGLLLPEGLPGKTFWGFKEPSYGVSANDRTIEFLKELYPRAIFVFIARNAFNVLASRRGDALFGNKLPGLVFCRNSCLQWKKQNQTLWRWHQSGKIRSFWVKYEDLIHGQGEILRLLEAMGKTFGVKQCDLLKANFGKGSSFQNDAYDERWKSLPLPWLAIALEMLKKENPQRGFKNPSASWVLELLGKLILADLFVRELFQKVVKKAVPMVPGHRARGK